MANKILTPQVYANTMLKLLKNNLVMGKLVTTKYNSEFKKVGDTIDVKRPPEFVVREGRVAQIQDVVVGSVPVKLDKQRGVDIEFDSVEETLSVDQLLMDETMNSKAATLAQEIDSCLAEATLEFPHWVGTPGETINSVADFFKAPKRMDQLALPGGGRSGIMDPEDYWDTAQQFTNGNIYDNNVNMTALQRAKLPVIGNVQPYMSQSVPYLTTGTRTNGTVDGANQNVNYVDVAEGYTQTINVAGLGAGGTVKKGEVFTIANVRAVNPRTKATQTFLQMFVVLEDATADGTGDAQLKIANPIISSGAYQTVNAAPANGAAVTWMGTAGSTYPVNSVFRKESIALTFAKLTRPRSGEYAYSTDPQTGVTIRYWQASDAVNDVHMHRWDVLFGVSNVDRRQGVRMSGTA